MAQFEIEIRGSEKLVPKNTLVVSKTDTKGVITYGNRVFFKLAGYKEEEIVGKPHNIVRHPDMPKVIFQVFWERLKNGKEINAYVKNLSKDGLFYWVFANVTPSFNNSGKIIGYHSARVWANPDSVAKIEPIYKELLNIEAKSNIKEARKFLKEYLREKELTYEKFILSI